MMKSKSVSQYNNLGNKFYSDQSIPFAININKTETEPSVKAFTKPKNDKVAKVDVNGSNIGTLYNLERMRHKQNKALEYSPRDMNLTKNVNYLHNQPLNDNYILSKLSHTKTYYKSVQSKMVNPHVKKYDKKSRRGSVEEPTYKQYITPGRSEIANTTSRASNYVSDDDESSS